MQVGLTVTSKKLSTLRQGLDSDGPTNATPSIYAALTMN